ncbi:MAG: hypothetical protein QOF51_385 [Chloroflexota bacterium]|nr:hypothetical protein [Chloroflexota bacterium]
MKPDLGLGDDREVFEITQGDPTRSMERSSGVRLAEVMACLSMATDLGMGQPVEFALRSCVLGVRLGARLGFDDVGLRGVYYQALLRYIGCNAGTDTLAALFGDELVLRRVAATVDTGSTPQALAMLWRVMREARAGGGPLHLVRAMAEGLLTAPRVLQAEFAGHCEVAERLATRLGFEPAIVEALGQLYERWDGRGLPHGIRGEAIAPAVRVVALAQDALTFSRLGGVEAATQVARERAGGAYDPRVAEAFITHAADLLAGLDDTPAWDVVLAMEPAPHVSLTEAQLDDACAAVADFADLKSPYALGHSGRVGALAEGAARRFGLPEGDAVTVRRAGLLHDVGQVGVTAAIWAKPGPLGDAEWERARLHPYYTERVLARSHTLASVGAIAALHHERLDGSGYHRAAPASSLSPAARILAVADAYDAIRSDRSHRPGRDADVAADELRREARAGRLDADAVAAVLAAAGHRVPGRPQLPAGLTAREIEVLRLVARGRSMKQMAATLVIAEKTVDNHVQHIYSKIGVSTRAGATLFAMERDLLGPDGVAGDER